MHIVYHYSSHNLCSLLSAIKQIASPRICIQSANALVGLVITFGSAVVLYIASPVRYNRTVLVYVTLFCRLSLDLNLVRLVSLQNIFPFGV